MGVRTIALLLLIVVPVSLRAQSGPPDGLPAGLSNPDSLRAWVVRPPSADTARLRQLVHGSLQHISTNLDSARALARAAVTLAWRRGQGRGLVGGLGILADADYYATDYLAAQRHLEMLLWAGRRTNRPDRVGSAYMGLGLVARVLENPARAEQYFVQAQQTYAAIEPPDVGGELRVLANRAYNFLDIDSLARARPLVRQAIARLQQFPQARGPAKYRLLLGILQEKDHHLDSATATYALTARLAHDTHDLDPEAVALLHLAGLAMRRADYSLALRYAQQAQQLFRDLGDPQEAEALRQQAEALVALRRPEAAAVLRRYLTLSDSTLRQQRLADVATAQARFDAAGQQARIRALEQQRRITALEADRRALRARWTIGWVAVLVVGSGGGLIWLYRRRQAAREAALRTRLAADLHDDVGGLLTQISLESALLEEGRYSPAQQQARLQRVAEASRSAARQMRDVVWSVDARNDSFASLLDRMHDHAQEVLAPAGIELEFSVAPGLRTQALSLQARQNLYLIFKEALHNVVKHAHATEVRVSLELVGRQLRLTVRDNGRGGPTAEQLTSHGLRNMRMRAEAVGGTVQYDDAPPGFGVVALLPV